MPRRTEKRNAVQRFGVILGMAGVGCLALILIAVLVNGRWPPVLLPVQDRFALIHQIAGDGALIVEVWLAAMPGLIVYWIGGKLHSRSDSAGR